jgi:hypothetical protein
VIAGGLLGGNDCAAHSVHAVAVLQVDDDPDEAARRTWPSAPLKK